MQNELKKMVDRFALGAVQEKYDSLRKLIADRKHHAAAKEKLFQQGIDELVDAAGNAAAPNLERLLAVATLGRLAATVKRMQPAIYQSLQEELTEKLPNPSLLSEPDDRSYIGNACEQVQPDWGADYCAQAAIHEKTGEQAREAFLKALLTMQPDLSAALQLLEETAHGLLLETEDPGTSVARRLKRIMDAIQVSLSGSTIEPGEDPGNHLASLCRAVFKDVAAPKKEESLFEAAEGVAGAIHELVRLRFSLATETSTYSALKVIKYMLPVSVWDSFASKSPELKLVSQDISEAILILAKQGITDDSLAGALSIAAGHKKHATRKMKQLAKTPGLSAEVKNWLAGGNKEIPAESETGESQQLSDDSQLADLLVDTLRFQALEDVGREQILPEILMFHPQLGEGITRLLQSGTAICDAIQAMARRRRLQVRGAPGDEEEYAPLEHEVIGDSVGIRRVRIIRPVVEQVRENGVSFVISKGVVEKIK